MVKISTGIKLVVSQSNRWIRVYIRQKILKNRFFFSFLFCALSKHISHSRKKKHSSSCLKSEGKCVLEQLSEKVLIHETTILLRCESN